MSNEDLQLKQVEAEKEVEFAAVILSDAVEDNGDLLTAIKRARLHLEIAERKCRFVNAELHAARIGSRA